MKLSKQFNSFHVFSSFFLSPKLSCFLNFVELTRRESYVFEMEIFSRKKKLLFFRLECEFRHLSLAEYLTALHVHVTGDSLLGFPRDRKELILQYLSGLASSASTRDQTVVRDFLAGLGSQEEKDALVYLKQVQKMKGEWYNQQGKQAH